MRLSGVFKNLLHNVISCSAPVKSRYNKLQNTGNLEKMHVQYMIIHIIVFGRKRQNRRSSCVFLYESTCLCPVRCLKAVKVDNDVRALLGHLPLFLLINIMMLFRIMHSRLLPI